MVDNYALYLQSTSRMPRPISSKLCFVASEHGIREELIIVRRNSYRTVGDSKYFTTLLKKNAQRGNTHSKSMGEHINKHSCPYIRGSTKVIFFVYSSSADMSSQKCS